MKTIVGVACGLLVGGGAVQMLHAESKPPAFVVAEIAVSDLEGYEMNFLKPAQKTIADHGGKYLAEVSTRPLASPALSRRTASCSFNSRIWTLLRRGAKKAKPI